jgi:hypothetical protein
MSLNRCLVSLIFSSLQRALPYYKNPDSTEKFDNMSVGVKGKVSG